MDKDRFDPINLTAHIAKLSPKVGYWMIFYVYFKTGVTYLEDATPNS